MNSYSARYLIDLFKNLEQMNFAETPSIILMNKIRQKAVCDDISLKDVERILARMKIEIDPEQVDAEFYEEISSSFSNCIKKFVAMFKEQGYFDPVEMTVSLASGFSIKLK